MARGRDALRNERRLEQLLQELEELAMQLPQAALRAAAPRVTALFSMDISAGAMLADAQSCEPPVVNELHAITTSETKNTHRPHRKGGSKWTRAHAHLRLLRERWRFH